jgi:hypothetical protein
MSLGIRNGRAQFFQLRPVADREDRTYARSPRSIQHGIAILVKVGYIHVRM